MLAAGSLMVMVADVTGMEVSEVLTIRKLKDSHDDHGLAGRFGDRIHGRRELDGRAGACHIRGDGEGGEAYRRVVVLGRGAAAAAAGCRKTDDPLYGECAAVHSGRDCDSRGIRGFRDRRRIYRQGDAGRCLRGGVGRQTEEHGGQGERGEEVAGGRQGAVHWLIPVWGIVEVRDCRGRRVASLFPGCLRACLRAIILTHSGFATVAIIAVISISGCYRVVTRLGFVVFVLFVFGGEHILVGIHT